MAQGIMGRLYEDHMRLKFSKLMPRTLLPKLTVV